MPSDVCACSPNPCKTVLPVPSSRSLTKSRSWATATPPQSTEANLRAAISRGWRGCNWAAPACGRSRSTARPPPRAGAPPRCGSPPFGPRSLPHVLCPSSGAVDPARSCGCPVEPIFSNWGWGVKRRLQRAIDPSPTLLTIRPFCFEVIRRARFSSRSAMPPHDDVREEVAGPSRGRSQGALVFSLLLTG